MLLTFKEIKKEIELSEKRKIVVVAAEDEEVLLATHQAVSEHLVSAILIGDKSKIESIAEKLKIELHPSSFEILHEPKSDKAAKLGCTLIREGRGQVLMKGLIDTAIIMSAVLNKEHGLNIGKLISHVSVFELPNYPKLLLLTDPAITLAPDVIQKGKMISNAVKISHLLQNSKPAVACLCAIEKVNPSMQATVDAAILSKMGERGQIDGSCIIDGPLAFDNAISLESAKIKKIEGQVAGKADILLCHNIEMANALYKSLNFIPGSQSGAVVIGAAAPMVLTSRADSHQNKYFSILLSLLCSKLNSKIGVV